MWCLKFKLLRYPWLRIVVADDFIIPVVHCKITLTVKNFIWLVAPSKCVCCALLFNLNCSYIFKMCQLTYEKSQAVVLMHEENISSDNVVLRWDYSHLTVSRLLTYFVGDFSSFYMQNRNNKSFITWYILFSFYAC